MTLIIIKIERVITMKKYQLETWHPRIEKYWYDEEDSDSDDLYFIRVWTSHVKDKQSLGENIASITVFYDITQGNDYSDLTSISEMSFDTEDSPELILTGISRHSIFDDTHVEGDADYDYKSIYTRSNDTAENHIILLLTHYYF